MKRSKNRLLATLLTGASAVVALLPGCNPRGIDSEGASGQLEKVILQTDWFPQPEHGGFYQALAKGYYREAGLEVEILPGGPNAMSTQKVLKGTAHFAMNRADTIYALNQRDVPIVMVMATLQHDPQALLLHSSNPLTSLEQLDGQRVMAIPGLTWIKWLEARYAIRLNIIPHDFGMERFLNDPAFIQQCLLTNEPFYVQQAGVEARILPLRASGFDPYHGIYCLQSLIKENPSLVKRFVAASIRGWRDFIMNDPEPAFELISSRNPKMSAAFMAFSHSTLREQSLVTGEDETGRNIGQFDPLRLDRLARELRQLGLVEGDGQDRAPWYSTRFIPLKPGGEPGREHP